MSSGSDHYAPGTQYMELAATGEQIVAIVLDSGVVVHAGDSREYEFRIENDIELVSGSGELTVRYDPYSREQVQPTHITELATIVTCYITRALVTNKGVLRLQLTAGTVTELVVKPCPLYEAWVYTHDNYILACPPGGLTNLNKVWREP